MSPVLLGEVAHVARRLLGATAAHALIDDIRRCARAGRVILPEIDPDVLDVAQAVSERYRDLGLDLAGAVNVSLAARYQTKAVLSLDRRDFRAIRPLTGQPAFVLLPDDA